LAQTTLTPDRTGTGTGTGTGAGAPTDTPAGRIVDAALRCIGRWGLSKTTVDDIARQAGVGRATLYRLFPGGRDAVVEAVVATETGRLLARIETALADVTNLEDCLVALMSQGVSTLAHHEALQFLLAYEPEVILAHLAFGEFDRVLAEAVRLLRPYLAPWVAADGIDRAAEWLARIAFSYLCASSPEVDFGDPQSVRRLVRTFILPAIPAFT
jgi:AcrR family transcriptional regulator